MSRIRNALANAALLASAAGLGHLPGTVTIVCRVPGIRRNGTTHPATETYPIGRWSEDELLAFERDPAFDVRFDLETRSAPGADTADAVQDQGAGPPTPDLGAKPYGTGPSAPIIRPGEPIVPAVLDESRVAAIRGRLNDLGNIFRAVDRDDRDVGEAFDYALVPEDSWLEIETLLGFRPEWTELEAALRFEPPVVTPIGASTGRVEIDVAGLDASLSKDLADGGLSPAVEAQSMPGTTAPIDRIAAIRAALPQLVKDRDYTRGGQPKIEVVEKIVGFELTRAEIEAAQTEPPAPAV